MSFELSGLVAYPGAPSDIGICIVSSLTNLHHDRRFRELISWEENDIPGRFISTRILNQIDKGNVFFADISKVNFNVNFEIGFAIAKGKRAFLIRNEAIKPDSDIFRSVGIFDTLGYQPYRDSSDFTTFVSEINSITPISFDKEIKNNNTPVYVVLPQIKGEAETRLIARIKKGRLFYRSFDPEEHGRLSAVDAIENVAMSHGVVISLLPNHFTEAIVHNLRSAFVAGLAMGMEKNILFLQNGDDPVPIDYRDLVSRYKFPNHIDQYVAEFAPYVYESIQSVQSSSIKEPYNFLERLYLGASSAENEFQELSDYYLETDEFRRALRGEVQVVLGRKGSGKTALFFQLRNRIRDNKKNVVLDLKPEGFQLIKFKDQVLEYLEDGTREHTITAFWEYLLLLEICHKLIEKDQKIHLRDHKLYPHYRELTEIYNSDDYITEGDFAERMLRLTHDISLNFESIYKGEKDLRLSNEKITQFLYKHDLAKLHSKLIEYLKLKESIWILFDNLDKGWPPHGVTSADVLSLRCLIDAMEKMKRIFQRNGISAIGTLFIRNDVYENLVDTMPDRGKISEAHVDWTDPDLLLELLRRRFINTSDENDPKFDEIWAKICVSHINGEETSHYMIERCLMRPRSLIEFIRYCRSRAINLRHTRIEEQDIVHGEEQYSTKLVNDISYEIQDIFPFGKEVLYEFIECSAELSKEELFSILSNLTEDAGVQNNILDILLWYGFLGFRKLKGESTYIYSVRYDMKRFKSLIRKRTEEGIVYTINPAFWRGLEIH